MTHTRAPLTTFDAGVAETQSALREAGKHHGYRRRRFNVPDFSVLFSLRSLRLCALCV